MGKEPELKIKVKVDPQLSDPQKVSNDIQGQIDKVQKMPVIKVEADVGNFSASLSKKLKEELKVVNSSLSYYLAQFSNNTDRMNAVANSLFTDLDFSKRVNLEFNKVKDEFSTLKNELGGSNKVFETVFANNKIKSKNELLSAVEDLGVKLKDVFDIKEDTDSFKKKLESILPELNQINRVFDNISLLSTDKKFLNKYGFNKKEFEQMIEPIFDLQDAILTAVSMLEIGDFSNETINDFIEELGSNTIGLEEKVTEACKSILTTFTTVQDKIYKEIESKKIDISPVGFDKSKIDEISSAYLKVMGVLVSQQRALNIQKERTKELEDKLVETTKKNVEAIKEQVEQVKSIFSALAESSLSEQVKAVADYSFEQNKGNASNAEILRRNEEKAKSYETALKNIEDKIKSLISENGLFQKLTKAFMDNGLAAKTAAEFIKDYTLAVADAKTAGVPPSLQKTGITSSSINIYAEKLTSVQKKLLELKDTTLPNFESALSSSFRYMFDPLIDNANLYKETLSTIPAETIKKSHSKPVIASQPTINSANINNYAKLIDGVNKSISDMKTTIIPDFDKILNENGLKIAQIGLSLKNYVETLKQGIRSVEKSKVPAHPSGEQSLPKSKTINVTPQSVENIRNKVANELSNIPIDIKSENIKVPTDPISLIGKIDVPSANITVDGKAIPDVIIDQKPKKASSKKKKQVEGQISFDDISTEQLENAAEKAVESMNPISLPGSIRIKKEDVTVNDFKVSLPGKVHLKKEDVITNNFKVNLPGKVVVKSEDVITPSAPIDIPVNAIISKKDDAGIITSLNDEVVNASNIGEKLTEASKKVSDYRDELGSIGNTSQYATQQVDLLSHALGEQIENFDKLDEKIKKYLENLERLNPVELKGKITVDLKDIIVPKKITLNGDLLIANATKEINEAAKKAEKKKKKKAISTEKNENSADSKEKKEKGKTPEELQKEYLIGFSGLYKKIMRTMNARDKSAGKIYDGTYVEDLDSFLSGGEFDSYLADLADRLKTTIGLLNKVNPSGDWKNDAIYTSAIKDGQHERKNYLFTESDKVELKKAKKEQEDYLDALRQLPDLQSNAFAQANQYGNTSENYRKAAEALNNAQTTVAAYESQHSKEFLESIPEYQSILNGQISDARSSIEKEVIDSLVKNYSKLQKLYKDRASLFSDKDISKLEKVDADIQEIEQSVNQLISTAKNGSIDLDNVPAIIDARAALKSEMDVSNNTFDAGRTREEQAVYLDALKNRIVLQQELAQTEAKFGQYSANWIKVAEDLTYANQIISDFESRSNKVFLANWSDRISILNGDVFKIEEEQKIYDKEEKSLQKLIDLTVKLAKAKASASKNPESAVLKNDVINLQNEKNAIETFLNGSKYHKNWAKNSDIVIANSRAMDIEADIKASKSKTSELAEQSNLLLQIESKFSSIKSLFKARESFYEPKDKQNLIDINNLITTNCDLLDDLLDRYVAVGGDLNNPKIVSGVNNFKNQMELSDSNLNKKLQAEIEAKKREYLKLLDEINKLLIEQTNATEDGISQQESAKLTDDIKKKQAELKGVKSFLTNNMSVGSWNDFERLKVDPKQNAFARAGERQINKELAAEEKKNADDLAKKARESESYVKKYEQSVDRYLKAKEAFDNADNLADWYKTRNEYENALEDMTSLEDYITGQPSIIDNAEYFDRYKKASDKAVLGENALAEALRRRQEAQRAALAANDEDLKSLNQFIAQVENMQGTLEKNLATDTPEYSSLLSLGNKGKSLFQFLDANPFDKNFAAQRWGQSVGYADIKTLEDAFAKLRKEAAEAKIPVQEIRTDLERLTKMTRNKTRVANLSSELNDYLEKFPKVGSSLADEVRELQKALSDPDAWKNAGELGLKMAELRKHAKELGLESENFYDKFKKLFGQHLGTAVVMGALHKMQDATRVIYQNVVNIDTAMTELRKVTSMTSEEYSKFTERAVQSASDLGVSVSEFINSTADWARLGYDDDEAERLATYTNLLRNVGD